MKRLKGTTSIRHLESLVELQFVPPPLQPQMVTGDVHKVCTKKERLLPIALAAEEMMSGVTGILGSVTPSSMSQVHHLQPR